MEKEQWKEKYKRANMMMKVEMGNEKDPNKEGK